MSLWHVFFLFSFILLNHDHDLNSWLFRITCISQLNIFVNLMLFLVCLIWPMQNMFTVLMSPVLGHTLSPYNWQTPTNTQSISFYAKKNQKYMRIPLTVASNNHFNITHNLCKFIWISYMKCTLLCVYYNTV